MKGFYIICVLLFCLCCLPLLAQMEGLHGDERYNYEGVHSGNQIRVSIYNDGYWGQRTENPDDFMGEWPLGSGNAYIHQIIPFVGSEVKDVDNQFRIIVSECHGYNKSDPNGVGDMSPFGEWWTMAPLPGFANDDEQRVAMSHWRWSWPSSWPDKYDDSVEPGWPGSWNGYFGKNVLNADQESYYVMDDYLNREFAFYPDSTDSLRRGLGIRGTLRGFQWSNVLVEDNIFFLYDAKNIGSHVHNKMNFGIISGPIMGNRMVSGGDGSDDGGAFDLSEELGWHFDEDDVGAGGWSPVGLHGLAFFESPGNPYDGIDNDGDAVTGSGATISEEMFQPHLVNVGEQVILTDYQTYERSMVTMPSEGVQIVYQNNVYTFLPGEELVETPNDLVDNNLNGLIDENNGSQFGEGEEAVTRYLFLDLKYVDYFSGEGADNILIDEERDDGIDNDGDWNAEFDDVGLDGVAKTGDPGEGDGVPTSGRGTELPGEPHIDKTDIDESDMIGLTAFNIYTPWTLYPVHDDANLWEGILPGYLNAMGQIGDTDILLGSGYYPLIPEQIERFSLGFLFGTDKGDLQRNKGYAALAYHENYNFAKAPLIPTVRAVAGDNQVTLYWDNKAEESIDPITGKDFEGYRIYRSTDVAWGDMAPITDMYGSVSYRVPMAQFDLDNEFEGPSAVAVNGVHFDLGKNTGLVHSFVDSTAVNGYTYYYSVTSYDHGDPELGIPASECSKYIALSPSGAVDMGENVVMIRPDAPAAGFVESEFAAGGWLEGSATTGSIDLKVVDQTKIQAKTYQVTFEDSLDGRTTGLYPTTRSYTLTDVSDPDSPDTLIAKNALVQAGVEQPIIHGFRLSLNNEEDLMLDTLSSGWSREGIYALRFDPYRSSGIVGFAKPSDYQIEFGDKGMSVSTEFEYRDGRSYPSVPVNFKVTNLSEGKEIAFALAERDVEDSTFGGFVERSRADWIIFLEPDTNNILSPTWNFTMFSPTDDTTSSNPGSGDVVMLYLNKPFLSNDGFEFTMKPVSVDNSVAKNQIENIKVVPNPYIVANSWEPANLYSSGRGPRELHFIHLPPKCTIKIFNVRGQLVQTLEHESDVWDGTEIWDMQTKDFLDISYGLYVYYVDAGEIGQKTGKFAVIK